MRAHLSPFLRANRGVTAGPVHVAESETFVGIVVDVEYWLLFSPTCDALVMTGSQVALARPYCVIYAEFLLRPPVDILVTGSYDRR